jgi:CXXC-20-CXXC protein
MTANLKGLLGGLSIMPTCQNCGHQWNWKETFVKFFTWKRGKKCPYCGHIQYLIPTSWVVLVFVIPLLWIVLPLFGMFHHYITILSFLVLILLILSMPFHYRLSNDKDAPWKC